MQTKQKAQTTHTCTQRLIETCTDTYTHANTEIQKYLNTVKKKKKKKKIQYK